MPVVTVVAVTVAVTVVAVSVVAATVIFAAMADLHHRKLTGFRYGTQAPERNDGRRRR
jgi:hypothetical protein